MDKKIDPWGRVIFNSADVIELLFQGHDISGLHIEHDDNVEQYNKVCLEHDKPTIPLIEEPLLTPEQDAERRQNTWHIPDQYKTLDVRSILVKRCESLTEIDRVNMEMDLFEERALLPVLRLMFYLVDQWRANGVVWGVGRGSSVASYCLFLIGVHRIDSLRYDLDIKEFLK